MRPAPVAGAIDTYGYAGPEVGAGEAACVVSVPPRATAMVVGDHAGAMAEPVHDADGVQGRGR